MGGGGACNPGAADSLAAIMLLAAAVSSIPHTGQFSAKGIWPLTGSTSKAIFWPQLQMIFISMMFYSLG